MNRSVRLSCLALLLALPAAPCCRAAPAPWPRRAPPRPDPGAWVLSWHGTRYDVTLGAGGTYHALGGGRRYWGLWHAEGGTLHVAETADGSAWLRWSCVLGATDGAVTIRRAGR